MDLQATKIAILFGLLISTSIAAMIPLLLIRKVEEAEAKEHQQDKKKKRGGGGLWFRIKNWFPCCRHKRSRLLSRFSIKTTGSMRSNGSGGHVHDMHIHGKKTTGVMSILNCFAGGVFLGTSFLGLMPEIRETFDEAAIPWPTLMPKTNSTAINETSGEEEEELALLPMTEIVVCCGLFLILIIEQTVHECLNRHNKRLDKRRHSHQHQSPKNDEETKLTLTSSHENSGLELKTVTSDSTKNGTVVLSSDGDSPTTTVTIPTENNNGHDHHEHHHHMTEEEEDQQEHHVVRSLILVVSLSMHSFLEGIAIGLQKKASSAVSIFVAVLFHKSLMAFSMGTSLVKAQQSRARVIKAAILFSVMSPIGIAIGIILKNYYDSSDTAMFNAVLQGLATGTFLYITFFEVLAREFEAHGYRIQKTIALLLGYVSIFCMVMTQHGT